MRRFFDSYRLLVRWQFLRYRGLMPMILSLQVLLGLGVVFGFTLLLHDIDPETARYFTTGAPTLGLIMLGFNVVPQEVSQAKLTGRYEYVSALPVPRLTALAADVSWWLIVQLPGMIATLLVASWHFHVSLRVGWTVVPAIALVALTGAAVGYGFASLVKPQIAMQLAQFVSITLLLFSPVNFPASRLPAVARAVHRVLPVQYMADIVRGSLTGHFEGSAVLAFAVVAAWCAAGLTASYAIAVRRA
jgi:ABC-2 type transport system permease protein